MANSIWGTFEPVCEDIGKVLKTKNSFHLVVVRSTVLPGTAETIVVPALEKTSGKKLGKDFGVCVNPEFMREGTAVADFLEPSVTVIGAAEASAQRPTCGKSISGCPGVFSRPHSAPRKW